MNTTTKIILFLVGAFIAYNIIVVAYAKSQKTPLTKLMAVIRYAPWLPYLGLVTA